MLLPQVRSRLKTPNTNNQALQDIFKSCAVALSVVSVTPYSGNVHNTKIVLQLDKGPLVPTQERFVERAHLYNRLNLADVLAGVISTLDVSAPITDIITNLNGLGFDFNEDDLEVINGTTLQAKETSLGYYNEAVLAG